MNKMGESKIMKKYKGVVLSDNVMLRKNTAIFRDGY